MTQLDELGLRDSTLVIFTSDNGYHLGEHNITGKQVAYEESIRIPLIARYPRWFAAGAVSEAIVLNTDFAPTVLDAVQSEQSFEMHGVSLRRILSSEVDRNSFLYEYYFAPAHPETPAIRAVRTKRFKYVTYPDVEEIEELYNLVNDPLETRNLIGDPAFTDDLEALRSELQRLRQETGEL